MKKAQFLIAGLIALFALVFYLSSSRGIEGDIELLGVELELILALVNSLIALFLFIITFTAYLRDQRKRILYVSIAFILLSVKSFLVASELFLTEMPWADPIIVVMEFIAMLFFFYGTLKK